MSKLNCIDLFKLNDETGNLVKFPIFSLERCKIDLECLGKMGKRGSICDFFLESYDNLSVTELHSFLNYVYLRYRKIYVFIILHL